jgi:hypothetical protein
VDTLAVEVAIQTDLEILAAGSAGRGAVHLLLFLQLRPTEITSPHDLK